MTAFSELCMSLFFCQGAVGARADIAVRSCAANDAISPVVQGRRKLLLIGPAFRSP